VKKSVTKNKSKPTLKSVSILIGVGILFAIFVIEIATRLMPELIPSATKMHFRDETYLIWGLIPDEELGVKYAPDLVDYPSPTIDEEGRVIRSHPVSTVSLGYQGIGFRDDGIDGETFAAVVGDSFASCVGVKMEECWVEILEQESGGDFANLGVTGYGPQQERRMLTKYGLPLSPKIVLWVFFANDPDDAWRFDQFGKGGIREGKFWESPIRTWLVENSATYILLTFFWHNRHFIYNLLTDKNNLPEYNNKGLFRRSKLIWWETVTDLTNPVTVEGINLTQKTILEAKQQTQLAGVEFVVVIIPTQEQIYYVDTVLQSQLDILNEHLVDFCRQNDIFVIDLTSGMKEKAQDEPFMYFRRDLHLNSIGNEIVAELLAQELKVFLVQ
jgi:hypothetical protein